MHPLFLPSDIRSCILVRGNSLGEGRVKLGPRPGCGPGHKSITIESILKHTFYTWLGLLGVASLICRAPLWPTPGKSRRFLRRDTRGYDSRLSGLITCTDSWDFYERVINWENLSFLRNFSKTISDMNTNLPKLYPCILLYFCKLT